MISGLKNFLQLINDNWATIVAVVTLCYGIYYKASKALADWNAKSEADKQAEIQKQIDNAKLILGEQILKLVSKAELDWQSDSCKLGPIRRAEVIEKIYAQYPVLLYAADQQEVIAYIDMLIDKALVVVRETIRKEAGIN